MKCVEHLIHIFEKNVPSIFFWLYFMIKIVFYFIQGPVDDVPNDESIRVIGGVVADLKNWPWMATLMDDVEDKYCGGSLISKTHVLTAAHCIYKYGPQGGEHSPYYVRVGEHDFDIYDQESEQTFDVLRHIVHEDYNSFSQKNDIAIVVLKKPVE